MTILEFNVRSSQIDSLKYDNVNFLKKYTLYEQQQISFARINCIGKMH